jgi:hypothetical protein
MFAELCAEIDRQLGDDKQGFFWRQVKEKFGSARFYYQFGKTQQPMRIDIIAPDGVMCFKAEDKPRKAKSEREELQRKVGAMINKAEAMTNRMCIICGKEAEEKDATGGYMLVLCEHHIQQRHSNPNGLDSPWFD